MRNQSFKDVSWTRGYSVWFDWLLLLRRPPSFIEISWLGLELGFTTVFFGTFPRIIVDLSQISRGLTALILKRLV